MMTGGRNVRGFRPSYKGVRHDYSDNGFDVERVKKANLMIYAARVAQGKPIFENSTKVSLKPNY